MNLRRLICWLRGYHTWEWVETEMGGLAWSTEEYDVDHSECTTCGHWKTEPVKSNEGD